MSQELGQARLAAALWECGRHASALGEALRDWHAHPEPDAQVLEEDLSLRRLTDQILYRFTKLQDAMGERLVPATLFWLQESHEPWPMRDKLDRLEKLGFLDVEAWLQWRDVRNRLAHEYPDQLDLRFLAVLAAVGVSQEMLAALAHWQGSLRLP
jgi:hypothetical protein